MATAAQKTIGAAAGLIVILTALWTWRTAATTGSSVPDLAATPSDARALTPPGSGGLREPGERAQAALPTAPDQTVPAAEGASTGSLRLRVVWARDQTPAAGVWMCLLERGAADPYRTLRNAQTDSAGELLVDELAPGPVVAKCDRGGTAQFQVVAGEQRTGILGIQAGFDVQGTVIDQDGRPFAGAAICAQIFGAPYEGYVVAHSNADGSFRVRDFATRTTVAISALAAGRTPTRQHVLHGELGESVALRLVFEAPGGAFSGRVLAPDGTPLPGARVLIGEEDDAASVALGDGTFGRSPAAQCAVADERGEFMIEGVGSGAHPVQARAVGFAPWKGEIEIVAGRTSAKDLVLASGASLSGVVRDEAGAPRGGVDVCVSTGVAFATTFRRTRADGSYSMRDLPLGKLSVTADDEDGGYAETTLIGVEGGELRWDPVLSKGLRLRVQLVAPGSALANWRITVEEQPQSLESYADTRSTGADGRVEFVNVPDAPLRLTLRAPGPHAFPRAVLQGVRARDGDVSIQPDPALEPTVYLRGRCLDPDGKPLGGVRLAPMNPALFYPPLAVSDPATGEFAFGPLPAGEWSVRGIATGLARLRTPSARVDAGVRWDFGDLQLQRGGTVVAELTVPEGASRGLPSVVLRDAAGGLDELVVESGVAHSSLVPPGPYTLIASGEGLTASETRLDVREGEETRVAVELKRP